MAVLKEHNPEHIFTEKERIERLSSIREIIFGAQDGLLVPLGVISSVAGAFGNNHIVIVAGISEALAGAFSMATGAFLASQAENQVHKAEMIKERHAIHTYPEDEKTEMALLFERDGVDKKDSQKLAQILAKYHQPFFITMVQKELGLEPHAVGTAFGDGVWVGGSYLISAAIPLFPYFFLTGIPALITSIVSTFLALFVIGVVKGRLASLPLLKSGLQVLLVGAGSGFGGYLLGTILPHLLGIK